MQEGELKGSDTDTGARGRGLCGPGKLLARELGECEIDCDPEGRYQGTGQKESADGAQALRRGELGDVQFRVGLACEGGDARLAVGAGNRLRRHRQPAFPWNRV